MKTTLSGLCALCGWLFLAAPIAAIRPDIIRSERIQIFSPAGDKIRAVQFRGAGTIAPGSLFFGNKRRLLVTPGLYEFTP